MNDTYAKALAELHRRSAAAAGFTGNPVLDHTRLDLGLARSRALLDALSSPDRQLRIIHVAGSKGKGTTAAFLANILTDCGLRAGLSTSPHLHSFRERMAIDGESISSEQFGMIAGEVVEAASRIERSRPDLGDVSAFEILVAMSLRYFADEQCDFAVLEVGLGGRFDNTNVVLPEVSVITTLELEHTAILGPTIQDIAWNKGGIIKPDVPVVSSRQAAEATAVLEDIAGSRHTRLLLGGRDWDWQGTYKDFRFWNSQTSIEHLEIQMPGTHQVENAATALAAILLLRGEGLPPTVSAIRSGLSRTSLPGRFEIVEDQGRRIVLDGAHTPRSARLLLESLEGIGILEPSIVAGFLRDKDIPALVTLLAERSSRLFLAPVDNPRSATVDELEANARLVSGETVEVFATIEEAWRAALETSVPDCPTVVTGSMSVVAKIRELLCLTGNS
jgi:dihydrofolate synthase / folylpolyglutamate synthase